MTAADAGGGTLPLRRVSLYKNGVGYFEHTGVVHGDQSVRIDFTTAQLNDVLQSLTAVDLGAGKVTGGAYNSTTPLGEQLRRLPLGLGADPTSVDLYSAIRGAQVQVLGAGAPIVGRVLNVELREVATAAMTDSKQGDAAPVAERHFLTVVSDAGMIRTVELTGSTSVKLLDTSLRADVDRYLNTLGANHADGLRHLTLQDKGVGPRELRVSYISEVPVWKCTYRILFDGGRTGMQNATLQGWAVIDNTVGSDWDKVQLSLVSGAPQSFLQPISQPFYARRPEIGMPQQAQLTPQTHESGEPLRVSKVIAALEPLPTAQAVTGAGIEPNGTPQNGVMGGLGVITATVRASTPHATSAGDEVGISAGSYGPAPISFEDSARATIAPNVATDSFDDNFEYMLKMPVTIRKNESALVPILQASVQVEPVTLWSPQDVHPLRALWLTNTSGLTLDGGSFSMVQGGSFSGQGLLDPIHPGERRLLSYAADSAVRVQVGSRNDSSKLQQVTINKGIMREQTEELAEVEYLVHNAGIETRTVIVEQPKRQGWELTSDAKPEEVTATAYRFRVVTGHGETVHLRVSERHALMSRYGLAAIDEGRLTLLLRQNGDSAKLLDALQPVFEGKRNLAGIDAHLSEGSLEVSRIEQDQNRLRENLKALKGTQEERDLVRRYTGELNQQEDRLTLLKNEQTALQRQRQTAQDRLSKSIEDLNVEQQLL